jgi:hypothetical protein
MEGNGVAYLLQLLCAAQIAAPTREVLLLAAGAVD